MKTAIHIRMVYIHTMCTIEIIAIAIIVWIPVVPIVEKPAGICPGRQPDDNQISSSAKIKASVIIQGLGVPHRIIIPIGIPKPIGIGIGVIISAVIIVH